MEIDDIGCKLTPFLMDHLARWTLTRYSDLDEAYAAQRKMADFIEQSGDEAEYWIEQGWPAVHEACHKN